MERSYRISGSTSKVLLSSEESRRGRSSLDRPDVHRDLTYQRLVKTREVLIDAKIWSLERWEAKLKSKEQELNQREKWVKEKFDEYIWTSLSENVAKSRYFIESTKERTTTMTKPLPEVPEETVKTKSHKTKWRPFFL